MTPKGLLHAIPILIYSIVLAKTWKVPQSKKNVWVILANNTKQETLCLSVATCDNPFSTCLVGLPMDVWPLTKYAIRVLCPRNEWIHNPIDNRDY